MIQLPLVRNTTRFNSDIPTCFSEGFLPLWRALYDADLSESLDLQYPTFPSLLSAGFKSSIVSIMTAGLKLTLADPASSPAPSVPLQQESPVRLNGVVVSADRMASSSTLPGSIFAENLPPSISRNGNPAILISGYKDYSNTDPAGENDVETYDYDGNREGNERSNRFSMMSMATSNGDDDFQSFEESEVDDEETDTEMDRMSTTFGNLDEYSEPTIASRVVPLSPASIPTNNQILLASSRMLNAERMTTPFSEDLMIATAPVELPWGKVTPAWRSPKIASLLYGGFEADVIGIRLSLLSHVSFCSHSLCLFYGWTICLSLCYRLMSFVSGGRVGWMSTLCGVKINSLNIINLLVTCYSLISWIHVLIPIMLNFSARQSVSSCSYQEYSWRTK
jgi:hypothetical protein